MGGQAFSSSNPQLPTPRMPPEVYAKVLAQTHAVLRKHYSHVESPAEAPGKETYGDVDTLVYGPLDPMWDVSEIGWAVVAENLARVLNAKKFTRQRGNPIVNFAIPWPQKDADDVKKEDKYVQLDVHTSLSLISFKWELFHTAHGDLWNILGSTIRPFGLTVNDQGMHLRIPEVELYDRKRSMVFLTADPSQVLRFLGLDEERWRRQFRSKEEMFEYATGCSMFWVAKEVDKSEFDGDAAGETESAVTQDIGGQEGGEKEKKKLKHNDRQRISKRPIFKAWIEEFIPRCRERGVFGNARASRDQIRQEAFTVFSVKEEYETRLKAWKLMKHQDDLWRVVIKGCVPMENVDHAFRAAAIRTLKATIMEGLEFDGMIPQAAAKDQDGFYDPEEVRQFVLENWQRAGRIGLARQEVRASEVMKAKKAKKEKEKETEDKKREVPI
jgi:hypothetical protein